MVQSACDVQLHGAPESSSHAVRLSGGDDVALHVASGNTAPPTARMHVTLRVCVPVGEHGAVVCACAVAEPAAGARPRLHGDHGPAAHTATSPGHGKRLQGRDDAGGGPVAVHADGSLGLVAPPDPGSDDMHAGGGAVDTPSDAASLVFRTQGAEQPLHG